MEIRIVLKALFSQADSIEFTGPVQYVRSNKRTKKWTGRGGHGDRPLNLRLRVTPETLSPSARIARARTGEGTGGYLIREPVYRPARRCGVLMPSTPLAYPQVVSPGVDLFWDNLSSMKQIGA